MKGLRNRLARSYWVWRAYHWMVADAVAIQRPTKYKAVYEFLGDGRGTVADIGCGPGVFTRHLATHARNVCSLDIDEASLQRVKSRHRHLSNVSFIVGNAEQLAFRDGALHAALVLETLEHVAQDEQAVREFARVLAPGGTLVLSVPVPPGETDEGQPWGHKREGYTLDQIRGLLERNGFAVAAHRFAEFKFSRLAGKWIRQWRRWLRLPAPIFVSWVAYLDFLLDAEGRAKGRYLPATVVVLARKKEAGAQDSGSAAGTGPQ